MPWPTDGASPLDWQYFTSADWAILAILGLSVLLSLWRGFIREAVSLASWIAAFVVANLYAGAMMIALSQWIANDTGRYIAAFAILFVATLVVIGLLGRLASHLVHATGLSLLDRLLGTVFGFARGVVVVLVFAYLLRHAVPQEKLLWLDQSVLMPHVDMLGHWARHLFSEYRSGAGSVVAL